MLEETRRFDTKSPSTGIASSLQQQSAIPPFSGNYKAKLSEFRLQTYTSYKILCFLACLSIGVFAFCKDNPSTPIGLAFTALALIVAYEAERQARVNAAAYMREQRSLVGMAAAIKTPEFRNALREIVEECLGKRSLAYPSGSMDDSSLQPGVLRQSDSNITGNISFRNRRGPNYSQR